MKANTISLINAILLISLSIWGYLSSETPSITALIPTVFGILLMLLNKGVKNENKVAAHLAVLLTLLVILGLIKPLLGSVERKDYPAIIRVNIMLLSSILAMVYFIKSFIETRKKRAASK